MKPRGGRWLRRLVIILMPAAAALLYAWAGRTNLRWQILGRAVEAAVVMLVGGTVLLAVDALLKLRRLSLYERAEDLRTQAEAREREILEVIRHELKRIQRTVGHFSNERLSLYRRDEPGFVLIGRASARPAFEESPGRQLYPIGEGCLGRAWDEGTAQELGLPDPGTGPQPYKQWVEAQRQRWAVPEETALGLHMRSQTYVAFRIESVERSVGVLVFESTVSTAEAATAGAAHHFSIEALSLVVKDAGERLADLVRLTASMGPLTVRARIESARRGDSSGEL